MGDAIDSRYSALLWKLCYDSMTIYCIFLMFTVARNIDTIVNMFVTAGYHEINKSNFVNVIIRTTVYYYILSNLFIKLLFYPP